MTYLPDLQAKMEGIAPYAIDPMLNSVRQRTWQALEDIRALIVPGMTEKDAIRKANAFLAKQGVKKFWHRTYIRFGKSTVLGFDDAYHENVILQEDDIFYIDIGPVWDDIEADCGKTFVIGSDPKKLKIASDVEKLFYDVRDYWRVKQESGLQLLKYAETITEKMGYVLHPSYVKGHRLSEFSHVSYTKAQTLDLNFTPSSGRWVLEFQICDRELNYGAFFEDILE